MIIKTLEEFIAALKIRENKAKEEAKKLALRIQQNKSRLDRLKDKERKSNRS